MGLRIQTNVMALNTHRQLSISDANLTKSLEKLSSGYRVNRAADDAAGLSMSSKFTAQVRSMGVASRNASQANSLLQIAEGGMDQLGNILARLKELATQAASANSSANLTDINAEASALKLEMDRIANSTTFQGTALLTGYGVKTTDKTLTAQNAYGLDVTGAAARIFSVQTTDGTTITMRDTVDNTTQTLDMAVGAATYNFTSFGISFKTNAVEAQSNILVAVASAIATISVSGNDSNFQIGETNGANYRISFQLDAVTTGSLSVGGINLETGAQAAMTSIDNAISALASSRADIGAIMNRLDYTSANLATAIENASAANSVIKDVDMAAEMTNFTKNQILVQAGTAMLAQANQSPQLILSLLGR